MSVNKPKKKFRQVDGRAVEDPLNIANIIYNEASGAQKGVLVGPFLKPLFQGGTYTTDATTAKAIYKGATIAVYNNSTILYAITFGDSASVLALAPGVTDVDGNVGLPCRPGDWTYFNSDEKTFVRSNNAALLVFVMKDESKITSQG